ncbi:integral membrane protein DUF92-domain-containing protein [Hygrophoropsis aurantiaca]|uniref:Integral membrane protein DUF92-domain-containing protein n=1 Tax=Hygrophoropsis aurantiaca TaxID=72124 RepID=A0ACB8A6I4_9AGAM|nr:integral membrane protein DUF92-domain-containing protein [Hygrophoropsis aurantiaca]
MPLSAFPIIPFCVATFLSVHGARSRSLSPSGAVAAFAVGFLTLAVPVRAIGFSLVVFYLLGSRATKYGKTRKAQLEDGFQDAGYRTAWQVLCNSFTAVMASALWGVLFAPDVLPWSLLRAVVPVTRSVMYNADDWCPLSPTVSNGLSRALVFATLGQFACCLGDTLASELGILSRSPPILITTLKPVPPGTNGGMSLGGTLASLAGGLVMGLTLGVGLLAENSACRREGAHILVKLVVWGTVAGGLGSLLDSLMGATIQRTRYSVETKKILQDESTPKATDAIKVISGLNLLTNNQVNLVSSTVTALVVATLA